MPGAEAVATGDHELLARAAAGDAAAFEAFLHRHEGAVFRLLRALAHDATDAEDAMQEAFVAAWRGAGGYRGGADARPWIFTIARHALGRLRRRRVDEPAPADVASIDALGVEAGWGMAAGGDALERLADRDAVERALAALSPADREVLLVRDVEGLSGDEAAAVLGLDLPALKSRLHRARLRFAARLTEGAHA